MVIRKWYFTTNVHGLRHAFDQIKVAVLSCQANLGLAPYCLVDGAGADGEIEARIQWLIDNGVSIIRHQASMLNILRPKFQEKMDIYSGHWLRCDIASLEADDDFVLYTDIDVIFLKPLPELLETPKYIACAPEHQRSDYSYFNSGVIIMNIPALRARRENLIQVVEQRLPVTDPWDDQSALNDLFKDEWLKLAPIWNWKPYWGANDDALIVHFHGPKPAHALRMQLGQLDPIGSDFRKIYERNPAGYTHYLEIFQTISSSNTTLVNRATAISTVA